MAEWRHLTSELISQREGRQHRGIIPENLKGSWSGCRHHAMLGREVATLVDEEQEAGSHQVRFDARGLASGIYFYRLQAAEFVATKKLILLK